MTSPSFLNSSSIGTAFDALALALVVIERAPAGLVLDVGCGTGIIGHLLTAKREDLRVLGIELDASRSELARALGAGRERVEFLRAEALSVELPAASAVCCNPPLLPGELGFMHQGQPLWFGLARKISREAVCSRIYLHLFEFHGIHSRSGEWPCMAELAAELGAELHVAHRGARPVSCDSQIRRRLADLAACHGDEPLLIDDVPVPLRELARAPKRYAGARWAIPHCVVELQLPDHERPGGRHD